MRPRSGQGFTLVELIVVITVLGILVAVAIPNFSGAQDKSRNSGVQHNLHIVQQALEEYGSEINHQYPTNLSGQFVGQGNNFLPQDQYPPTPWEKQQKAVVDIGYDENANNHIYLGEKGKIEDPVSSASYGAIMYASGVTLGVSSQEYAIGGIGKKGTQPMRVLTLKNH